jgi:puromycin-sensitive aminopeptidase
MDDAPYRLPRTVTPSRYELTLRPDLAAGTFKGEALIEVTAHETVTEIVLNAKELDITAASLTSADGPGPEVAKVRPDAEAERLHLELASALEPGPWNLRLSFGAPLNDRLTGFYRSTFVDDDGTVRTIATTHFEATDARRTFPCWDEPDLKAVFGVTLVVPEGLTAMSNGPEIERRSLPDGLVEVRFADSMVMSTYLVAFVVGPLVLTDEADARGVPSRVASVPGKTHLARFAQEVSVFCLNFFADYYDIPYPDAKVDHVALPDFAQGAMENLGCITYRETLLLVDPSTATQEELLDVAETIAHELAHMWFGDLVTMRWWNGIWLNEAFATFMSYLAVDAFRPEWKVWETFARTRTAAFDVDSLVGTRPIEFPVHSPDDASGMFDTLTYTKGGAVLRMLQQWLGPDRFRDGIRRYLREHAYGNTETHDLWDALEAETGEPVRRIMDAWIFQKGYPAISVTADDGTVAFSQRRFAPGAGQDDTVWPVPLLVRREQAGSKRTDAVIVEPAGLSLPLEAPDALVVANEGGASFVRVWYDPLLRQRLVARAFTALSPTERHDLVDDTWAAVILGDAPASSFVDLVAGFADETDLTVWQAILAGLGWCERFLEGEPRERFRVFARDLIRPAFERLSWDPVAGESDLTRALRGQLVQALGILADDPETKAQARELERTGASVDPSLVAAAVEIVAGDGGAEDFARYWAHFKQAPTPQEEHRYLGALGRFRDPELIDRLLRAGLTAEIRPQDAPFTFARATINREQGERAWRFMAEHWDEMTDRFAASNHISLVAGVRFLTAPRIVNEVQEFFRTHDIPQNRMQLQQLLERQRVMAALRERATPDLVARFGG